MKHDKTEHLVLLLYDLLDEFSQNQYGKNFFELELSKQIDIRTMSVQELIKGLIIKTQIKKNKESYDNRNN